MQSREFVPSIPLRPYVRLIWCMEIEAGEEFGPPERVAPDGIVELVLHYRNPLEVRFAGEPFATQPRSSLVLQTKRYVEFVPRRATGFVSVRFQPWGAMHFLAPPVAALADRCTPAEELWGNGVELLEERLALETCTTERVRAVEAFLLDRLARHRKPDVSGLLRTLWHTAGPVRLSQLSRDAGMTERTLERRCAAAVGMTPRSYRRLARFLKSCARLRRGDGQSLAEVAQECGYFDQAHFTNDFREFAGLTPRQFLAAPAFSFLELD